jgi:phosphoribosylglycinamide formyltransferase-1
LLKINKIPYKLALKLCVLASGSGTNLKAILNASKQRKISSKVVLVISNNSRSGALKTAVKFKIPSYHLSHLQFENENEFTEKLLALLRKYKVDMILLAGYMKMLNPAVIKKFRNRIINIHPALLPAFGGKGMYGIHVHEAVLSSGVKTTGASVHLVDEVYDNGAVVLQKEVSVKAGDDAEKLRKRVLRAEHRLYPEAIKLFEEKRVIVRNNKVSIRHQKNEKSINKRLR